MNVSNRLGIQTNTDTHNCNHFTLQMDQMMCADSSRVIRIERQNDATQCVVNGSLTLVIFAVDQKLIVSHEYVVDVNGGVSKSFFYYAEILLSGAHNNCVVYT